MSGLWGPATIDRPTKRDDITLACPPWCAQSYGHGSDDGHVYHEARETVTPLGPPDVTAVVSASRDDYLDQQGEPYVWVSGDGPSDFDDWATGLPPAAAAHLGQMLAGSTDGLVVQLGHALIAAAAVARTEVSA